MCFSRSVVDLLLCTLVQSYAPPWLWQALVVATMNVTMITPNDVSLRALSCRDVVNGSARDGCAEVQRASRSWCFARLCRTRCTLYAHALTRTPMIKTIESRTYLLAYHTTTTITLVYQTVQMEPHEQRPKPRPWHREPWHTKSDKGRESL